MSGYLEFLIWPFAATIVLIGIHVYFGLHVIKRGIIFVDLSLAQVAALGMTIAYLFGLEAGGNGSYFLSLLFALAGATIFTFTRGIEGKIPQEAFIGIVYAVASAAVIMAVSHAPDGTEHIKHLLAGSILTVSPLQVLKTAGAYSLVGLFHWIFRKRFTELTFGEVKKERSRLWDFLFYASFALVVTSSVSICGVLLVFIFLVVPSVFGALMTDSISRRLLLGWLFGIVGSAIGLAASVWLDTPSGATIVCVFGLLLLMTPLIRRRKTA